MGSNQVTEKLQNVMVTILSYYSTSLREIRSGVMAPPNVINPLKPTGYVMHQQFNIQQLYVLPTLYLSENKQRLVPLTA